MHTLVDDEESLWKRLRHASDQQARTELLALHLPYAKVVAATLFKRRHSEDVEFDDYLQWARVGLLEAFERYEPSQGAQFRTFAASRMRGAVLDGLERHTERQSQVTARRRLIKQRTASIMLGQGFDAGDPLTQLAEVGMALALGFMLEETTLLEVGQTAGPETVYQAVEVRRLGERARSLIERLPASEREVIRGHYLQGLAFDEMALALGVTRGRISQIHKQALATLRRTISTRQAGDIIA